MLIDINQSMNKFSYIRWIAQTITAGTNAIVMRRNIVMITKLTIATKAKLLQGGFNSLQIRNN